MNQTQRSSHYSLMREAEKFAREVLKINKMADHYAELGNLNAAKYLYSASIEISPTGGFAINRLGMIQCMTGNFSDGIGLLTKAVKDNPSNEEYVRSLDEWSKHSEEKEYENVHSIDCSKLYGNRDASEMCELAVSFTNRGLSNIAEQLYNAAIAICPEISIYALSGLLSIHLSARRLTEARSIVDKIKALNSRYSKYINYKGELVDDSQPISSVQQLEERRATGFVSWLNQGHSWISSAKWSEKKQKLLLESLYRHDYRWVNPVGDGFNVCPTEDWLDEQLARAEALSSRLRLQPINPSILSVQNLTVIIWTTDFTVYGWVSFKRVGICVSINTKTWDLYYVKNSDEGKFSAGIVLAWFLDCSMVLEKGYHPHYEHASPSRADNLLGSSERNAFISSGNFDAYVRSASEGKIKVPKTQRVRGHVRTLADGTPTEEARGNAPSYIRRNLKEDQTFVRSYTKGPGFEESRLIQHLHNHSNVADAISGDKILKEALGKKL